MLDQKIKWQPADIDDYLATGIDKSKPASDGVNKIITNHRLYSDGICMQSSSANVATGVFKSNYSNECLSSVSRSLRLIVLSSLLVHKAKAVSDLLRLFINDLAHHVTLGSNGRYESRLRMMFY